MRSIHKAILVIVFMTAVYAGITYPKMIKDLKNIFNIQKTTEYKKSEGSFELIKESRVVNEADHWSETFALSDGKFLFCNRDEEDIFFNVIDTERKSVKTLNGFGGIKGIGYFFEIEKDKILVKVSGRNIYYPPLYTYDYKTNTIKAIDIRVFRGAIRDVFKLQDNLFAFSTQNKNGKYIEVFDFRDEKIVSSLELEGKGYDICSFGTQIPLICNFKGKTQEYLGVFNPKENRVEKINPILIYFQNHKIFKLKEGNIVLNGADGAIYLYNTKAGEVKKAADNAVALEAGEEHILASSGENYYSINMFNNEKKELKDAACKREFYSGAKDIGMENIGGEYIYINCFDNLKIVNLESGKTDTYKMLKHYSDKYRMWFGGLYNVVKIEETGKAFLINTHGNDVLIFDKNTNTLSKGVDFNYMPNSKSIVYGSSFAYNNVNGKTIFVYNDRVSEGNQYKTIIEAYK